MDSREIYELALRLAQAAGARIEECKSGPRSRRWKGRNDFVTDADHAATLLVISGIREAYPGHGIVCEDFPEVEKDVHDVVWIVDPLDGTTNYIHGYPAYCVSICCHDRRRDRLIASAVHDPVARRSFGAHEDEASTLNGSPIRVTDGVDLRDSLVLAGMSHHVEPNSPEIQAFTSISSRTAGTRRSGCAALDLCFVAAGFADAYFHYNLKAWDVAAGAHIVRNAGGHVTNIGSDRFSPFCPSVLATNGRIHASLQKEVVPRGEESTWRTRQEK